MDKYQFLSSVRHCRSVTTYLKIARLICFRGIESSIIQAFLHLSINKYDFFLSAYILVRDFEIFEQIQAFVPIINNQRKLCNQIIFYWFYFYIRWSNIYCKKTGIVTTCSSLMRTCRPRHTHQILFFNFLFYEGL